MNVMKNDNRQLSYCGIRCADCGLGNGEFASTAGKTAEFIDYFRLAEWSGYVPGGEEIDVPGLRKGLSWIASSVGCPGCQKNGGPPECPIRNCARALGLATCGTCDQLDNCEKFDWLGEKIPELKMNLKKEHLR